MNSRRYWKNRLPFLLTNLVCMAALTVFLLVCGNSVSQRIDPDRMGIDFADGTYSYLLETETADEKTSGYGGAALRKIPHFRSDGATGTGRGSVYYAFENGRENVLLRADWRDRAGTPGVQGIH